MKKRIITAIVIVVIAGLVYVGISTGVLTGKVLPALGKVAKAVPPRLWVGLLFKLLVLTGLMGWITRLVNARKERFLNGEVEYSPIRDYVLIVGYDFQTKPLIKRILTDNPVPAVSWPRKFFTGCVAVVKQLMGTYRPSDCILLVTDRDVRSIRAEMATELTDEESKRVLYMRRDLALERTYAGLQIWDAKAIYMMGDEGISGRDGILLQASKIIAEKVRNDVENELQGAVGKVKRHRQSIDMCTSGNPIKVYLQFEDPSFYSQMCSEHLPMDPETYPDTCEDKEKRGKVIPETLLFDLEVFNYYDSWVWKCWSEKDSADADARYLPLRFKADAERVELFVIGDGKALKAVVDAAVTLMNYGKDHRNCRLTVVSDRAIEVLPSEEVVAELPELEVVGFSMREFGREVAARLIEVHSAENTAVTVVFVEDAPEKSVREYMGLPFALRCSDDISVLMWMGAQSRGLPDKILIAGAGEHRPQMRYFGMSNILPWYGSSRQGVGADVSFYYSVHKQLPKGVDPDLVSASIRLWDVDAALTAWNGSPRWGKNSSINSAGSYKEKAAIIAGDSLTPELQLRLLKAEHNRWWVERLMANWRVGRRDNVRRLHPNLVPFEELDEPTKDIDKINIAAMTRQGYVSGR